MLHPILIRTITWLLAVTLATQLLGMAAGPHHLIWSTGVTLFLLGPVLALLSARMLVVTWLRRARGGARAEMRPIQCLLPAAAGMLVLSAMALDGERLIPSGFREWGSRERAYLATMKSNLRDLYTAEVEALQRTGAYTADPTALLKPSAGVIGPRIALTPDGWTATVKHTGTVHACVVYAGSTAIPPAVSPVEPMCTGSIPHKPGYRLVEYLAIAGALAVALLALRVGRAS